jgi:tRNA dimethylallyltransferase
VSTPDVVAIVGPTAVGKSGVADRVALALNADVVSADAMQVYRGMDIGTAKLPPGERLVTHHCIDLVDPGEPYSAALFQEDARRAVDELLESERRAVVSGGTGLYVRAALDVMSFPAGDPAGDARAELEQRGREQGTEVLHAELATVDPTAAALIHPNNTRRVIRALEMHAEGTSYAIQAARFADRRFHYQNTRIIGLTMDRASLYARIDARVDAMMEIGLLAEVEELLNMGLRTALTAAQAIGYKELVAYLDGLVSLDDAVDAIKQASRRYAKRQLTWFRADDRITWFDVTGLPAQDASEAVLELLESSVRT